MFIAMLVFLTGCFNHNEKNKKLSLEQVMKALETEGIEMFSKDEPNDWVLNKVKPNRYSVSRPLEKAPPEYISVYIFDSEKARKKGLDDFNKQKEKYDMILPNIYEQRNVIILYWPQSDMDNSIDKFDVQIKRALGIPVPLNKETTNTKDDFELTLFADKTTYSEQEPIQIWTNFKYLGKQEEIKIGHALHYIGFDIAQLDGSFTLERGMPLPYITTIIKKGIVYKKDYSSEELKLPPGTYRVLAVAHFDLPDLQQTGANKEFKTIRSEIIIKVTK